jgi:hypothetical protein
MRTPAAIMAVLLCCALAGCGESGADDDDTGRVRGWIFAMNAGRYEDAAAYFARNALVDQGPRFRLRSRADAETFVRGLPCRADLTAVRDEGKTVLGTFRLRAGPGGPCKGVVKVRFTMRDGRFTEFRQLPGPDELTGPPI